MSTIGRTALHLKKINDLTGYETVPGPVLPVYVEGDDNAAAKPSTNQQTGTSYTLVLTDESKIIQTTSSSAVTITIPPNSSVPFDIGTIIGVEQFGTGVVTIAGGAGVTIRSLNGNLDLAGQYATATLRKVNTNEWLLAGAII